MITVELNEQEFDIVIGGLERLEKSLVNPNDRAPVTQLMARLIALDKTTK